MLRLLATSLILLRGSLSMPDYMCFVEEIDPIKSYSARPVISKSQQPTARACEVACADDEKCKAISYKDPICKYLGEATDAASCEGLTTIGVVVPTKSTICPERTDITKEMGKDPCAEKLYPEETKMDVQGICPRDDRFLVIRGINESGVRVTIDNEPENVLSYDGERQMWMISHEFFGFKIWLVAVSCATTINTYNCGCDRLQLIDPGRSSVEGGVEPLQNVDTMGTCADPTHSIHFWNPKYNANPDILVQVYPADRAQKVSCMPDIMCFNEETDPVKSLSGRAVLDKSEKETARACEVACGDNDQCKYIAYVDPYCYVLGAPSDDAGCSNQVTVRVKGDCKTRLNITAEFGKDICTSEIFDVATNKDRAGICPRDDRMMVIRAINESGARVTFDNDVTNVLTFDFNRNMWRFNHPDSGFTAWLVAVSCVATIDTFTCNCNPLPQMDPGRFAFIGPVDAFVGPAGACKDTTHQLTYWGARFGPNADYGNLSPDQAAKAGIWLLTKDDNSNGFQIVNATCSQMPQQGI